MGIKFKTAISIQRRFRLIIRSIFLEGARNHSTIDDMLDQVASRVYKSEEWQRSPNWVKEYLRGYKESRIDEVLDNSGWLMWIDGELLTKNEIDALTKTESEDLNTKFNKAYKSPWERVDNNLSRYCWKNNKTGLPLKEKPIDKKWRGQ